MIIERLDPHRYQRETFHCDDQGLDQLMATLRPNVTPLTDATQMTELLTLTHDLNFDASLTESQHT